MKWGEYSNDVQFILQRSEPQKTDNKSVSNVESQSQQQTKQKQSDQKLPLSANNRNKVTSTNATGTKTSPNTKSQRSHTLNNLNVHNANNDGANAGNHHQHIGYNNNIERKSDLIGVVKGVVQEKPDTARTVSTTPPPPPLPASPPPSSITTITTDGNESSSSISSSLASPQKLVIEFNSADVRNSLDRKTNALRNAINFSDESLDENLNEHHRMLRGNASPSDLFKSCSISSNGALAPPPYRNPPAPRASPPPSCHSQPNSLAYVHQKSDSLSSNNSVGGSSVSGSGVYRSLRSNKFDFLKEMTPPITIAARNDNCKGDLNSNFDVVEEVVDENVQHDDLMQLIKYQRDKINSQQADITKVSCENIDLNLKKISLYVYQYMFINSTMRKLYFWKTKSEINCNKLKRSHVKLIDMTAPYAKAMNRYRSHFFAHTHKKKY